MTIYFEQFSLHSFWDIKNVISFVINSKCWVVCSEKHWIFGTMIKYFLPFTILYWINIFNIAVFRKNGFAFITQQKKSSFYMTQWNKTVKYQHLFFCNWKSTENFKICFNFTYTHHKVWTKWWCAAEATSCCWFFQQLYFYKMEQIESNNWVHPRA